MSLLCDGLFGPAAQLFPPATAEPPFRHRVLKCYTVHVKQILASTIFAHGVSAQPTPKEWRGAPPLPAPDKRPSQPLQLGVACRQVCCMAYVKNNNTCEGRARLLLQVARGLRQPPHILSWRRQWPPFVRQPCGRLADSIQFGCPAAWPR